MKKTIMLLALVLGASMAAQASLYTENFESPPTVNNGNYFLIGGTPIQTPKIGFDTWAGVVGAGQDNATVQDDGTGLNNVMEVDSPDNASRGVGITLDPTRFGGAASSGTVYSVTFDVTLFEERGTTPGSGGAATFQIYLGKGYDLEGNDPRIVMDLGEALGTEISLKSLGKATSVKQGDSTVISGTGQVSVDFTYDGESAVNLMFGSMGGGTSRFRYQFDDLAVTEVVPEPATLGLIALTGAGLLVVRRFHM